MSYTIEQVATKEVTTKFGKKPTFSIKANGEWFKCGFKNPKVAAGDVVEFSFTEGAYGKDVDMDSFRKIGGGGSGSAPSSGASPAASRFVGGGKGVFPIPPLDGQRAIVRQNSITNAVALLREKFGKHSHEEMATQVIAVARMFEAYSCGDIDLALAKEKTKPAVRAVDEATENPFEGE